MALQALKKTVSFLYTYTTFFKDVLKIAINQKNKRHTYICGVIHTALSFSDAPRRKSG